MKKLFLLIPALVLSMMMSAKVKNITPTTPYDDHDNLRLALYYAHTEKFDTIILADGTYVEDDNYLYMDTNMVILAAEGAHPVIRMKAYAQIKNGANIKIKGLKFDGSAQGNYDYYFRFYDNSHTSLRLDNCDFYDIKQIVITAKADVHTDSCIVNNCFFYNNKQQAMYFYASNTEGRETCDSLAITNSTFANTDPLTNWISVIDIRPQAATNTIKVTVDHCTFYNNPTVDSGHANIRTKDISDVTVSNSIFAHPEAYARRATYCTGGGNINNCLTYNFTADGNKGHAYGPTVSKSYVAAPLFKDPEHNDFTLRNASPAQGRATNGKAMGDPRWVKDHVDTIAAPAILLPADAVLTDSAGVIAGTPDTIDFKLKTFGGSHKYNSAENAKWTINVTKAGEYAFKINAYNPSAGTSHKYTIRVYDPADEENPVLNETTSSTDAAGDYSRTTSKVTLEKKTYIVKVWNPTSWSVGNLVNVEANYEGGEIIAVPDTLWPIDALKSARAFVNEDGELRFTDDSHSGYVREQWAKWKISVADAGKYKFTANANSNNGQNYRITLKSADESATIGTWYGPNNDSGARKIATEYVDLTIGNYVVMIEDTVNYSHGRVANIVASYEGGKTVEVPGQILAKEAVIGKKEGGHDIKMYHLMESGDLQYHDNGHNMDEFATWTLNVTKAGEMAVTLNVSHAGHMFSLELYQGETRLDSIGEIISGDDKTVWDDGDITLPEHLTFPAVGTYTLKLLNNQAHSGGALHGITFARVPIVIDENATVNGNWAYCASDETIDLSIIRTLKGGMYNTICLPIELGSTSSMKAAFGEGYELLKLSGATLNGNELYITFESVETLEYGIPHLIKPVADVVNPSFTGRKIKTTTASTVTKGVVDFIGNFIVSEVPAGENNLFLGPDDLLYFSQTATPIKGMRAYFKVNVPGAANNIKAARIVKGTQVITEIDLVGDENKAVKTIENGQLVITIDGVRYNVMGTKIQ